NHTVVLIGGEDSSGVIFGGEGEFVGDVVGNGFKTSGIVSDAFECLIGKIDIITNPVIGVRCGLNLDRVTHPRVGGRNIIKIVSNVVTHFDESGGANIFPCPIDRGARSMSSLQLCLGNGAEFEPGDVRENGADDNQGEKASSDHHF